MKNFALVGATDFSLINFRFELLARLKQENNKVYAFAPSFSGEIKQKLINLGVEPVLYSLNRVGINPFSDIKTIMNLKKLIKRHNISSVLFYTPKPVIYGSIAAKACGVKNIYSMVTGLGYAFTLDTLKAKIIRIIQTFLYKLSLSFNKIIIFQNKDDLELFLEKRLVTQNKTVTVNGSGVNLEKFSPCVLPEKPVFLMAARLIKEKGIHEYIKAAEAVKKKYPDARFLLAGGIDNKSTGFAHRDIKAWANDGTIEYLGNLSDIRTALEMASVFVLPSYREGTPRSVLEAMAMGRAIITTNAPGCRETVVEGENGYLVEVGSSLQLTLAMMRFIEEPRLIESMGKNSNRLAKEKYDVNLVNDYMMDIMA